jgi:hypothetical protein
MAENMMNKDHKCTNKNFRDNYDKIFKKKKIKTFEDINKYMLKYHSIPFIYKEDE